VTPERGFGWAGLWLFSFDEFDECAVWVFDECYERAGWAEFVWFVCNCDFVFSHRVDGLFHVFDFEGDVVEQSVFVFWLGEFFLFLVEGEFKF